MSLIETRKYSTSGTPILFAVEDMYFKPPKIENSKKKSGGAFYFFMMKRRKELEDKGETFEGGLKDVSRRISAEWKEMSAKDKEPFFHKAKYEKATKDANIIQFQKEIDKCDIKRNIVDLLGFDVVDLPLFLVDFTPYCCLLNDGLYVPGEIALVAFSLRRGIIDTFSAFIDPNEIPMGYLSHVLNACDTYSLPVPGFDKRDQNIEQLTMKIQEFFIRHCPTNSKEMILFSPREEADDTASGCLKWLEIKSGISLNTLVYPYNQLLQRLTQLGEYTTAYRVNLFYRLQEKLPLNKLPYTPPYYYSEELQGPFYTDEDATRFLRNLNYASYETLACVHHMYHREGTIICPLNILQRTVYKSLDILLDKFEVLAYPHHHFPVNEKLPVDSFWQQEIFQENKDKIFPLRPKKVEQRPTRSFYM